MMKVIERHLPRAQSQLVSEKTVIRVLVVAVIILALVAGYFATEMQLLQRRYNRLEKRLMIE